MACVAGEVNFYHISCCDLADGKRLGNAVGLVVQLNTVFPEGELVPLADGVDQDLVKLEEYIEQLLGNDYNPARVKKQIKEFKNEYDYSYSGMLKTLIWWYEIKGNSKEKANGGIGIIPFVYKDALTYYYSLYLAQLANENVESIPKPKVKEIEIYSPEVHRRPPKMFNMEDEE